MKLSRVAVWLLVLTYMGFRLLPNGAMWCPDGCCTQQGEAGLCFEWSGNTGVALTDDTCSLSDVRPCSTEPVQQPLNKECCYSFHTESDQLLSQSKHIPLVAHLPRDVYFICPAVVTPQPGTASGANWATGPPWTLFKETVEILI